MSCCRSALTGVTAPIVVRSARRFPMIGAHKVLAAYACLVPRLVTGRFDPARATRGLAVDRQLLPRRRRDLAHPRLPRRRRAARRHEPGALRLARALGRAIPRTSSARRARRATSRRSTTSAPSWRAIRDNVILNQFSEFGNYLVHYCCTGPRARARVRRTCEATQPGAAARGLRRRPPARPARIAAGDYLKAAARHHASPRSRPSSARRCCSNGYGEHNIQGIGDKHIPLIHNVMNTDVVVGVSDRSDRRAQSAVQQRRRAAPIWRSGGRIDPELSCGARRHRPLRHRQHRRRHQDRQAPRARRRTT